MLMEGDLYKQLPIRIREAQNFSNLEHCLTSYKAKLGNDKLRYLVGTRRCL